MRFPIPAKQLSLFIIASFSFIIASAQTSKDKKIIADADEARAAIIRTDGLLANLFNNSYAYAIFPNVGKGGIGVGGAAGNGAVYRNGAVIGMAKMTQVTIGFQFGGQAYQEVIFFENADALNRFQNDNVELSAQASAVAVTKGAAASAKYHEGVMIFTQTKGGLMYEASVGGQKFKYTDF